MSGWDVDGAAENSLPTWSSFDEVEWIECEEKGDHTEGEAQSCAHKESTTRTSEDLNNSSSDQRYKHFQGSGVSDQNFKEAFTDLGTLESCHTSKKTRDDSTATNTTQDRTYKKHQHLDFSDPDFKEASFTDMDTAAESGHPNRAFTSPSKITTCDYITELTSGISQRSTSNQSSLFQCDESAEGHEYENHDYDFERAMDLYKEETNYQDASGDAVNNTCQFLLSDIYPEEGDLEFLQVQEGRRDNLLEYAWGNTNNLEDMDKLFLNNDSMLPQGFDDSSDGMLWEPPSPAIGGSSDFMQKEELMSVEAKMENSISLKEEVDAGNSDPNVPEYENMQAEPKIDTSSLSLQNEDNTESCKMTSWEGVTEDPTKGSENIDVAQVLIETEQANKVRRVAPLQTEDESGYAPKEGDKANKARRHGNRSKKLEDNGKQFPGRKFSPSSTQTKRTTLLYMPVAQDSVPSSAPISQVTRGSGCEEMNHIQHLQPVPYIHAGFGFPAHHHMPVMVPGPPMIPQQLQPQAQPVFIGYQPPLIDSSKLQRHKTTLEAPPQSPNVGTSTMTPQEKIEKLRWRQKMQARLAVEQQQQQLISQHLISDQAHYQSQDKLVTQIQTKGTKEGPSGSVRLEPSQGAEQLVWNEGSVESPGAVATEDGEESLGANVLHQLLDIASKMDIRTRLCLRDGFRRLAGNALQRRSAGDRRGIKNSNSESNNKNNVAESSSSSEQSCSQRMLTVEDIMETQTNPMDRFIAHLLFHKRFPSTSASLHINSNPSGSTPDNSQVVMVHQDAWPWPEAVPSSEMSPSAKGVDAFGDSAGQHNTLEMPVSDSICKNKNYTSGSFSSVVSGAQLEGSSDVPQNTADNLRPQNVNSDIEMESQCGISHGQLD